MINRYFLGVLFAVGILSGAQSVSAATMYASASPASVQIGDTIIVSIIIDTEGAGVNAAQATVQFPSDIVEATGIDSTESVFNFWLERPQFSNQAGQFSFIGGSTNGFNGHALTVLKARFKVKKIGVADFSFVDGAVTAGDGSGTNVLKGMSGASVVAAEASASESPKPTQITRSPIPAEQAPGMPKPVVELYPDPTAWNNTVSPFFVKWDLPLDISAVATAINQDPKFVPTKSEGLFDNKMFSALKNGVWYLHIRFKNNIGWSGTVHYRIAIDTIPPAAFEIESIQGQTTEIPNPVLAFKSADQLSGLANYVARIDGGNEIAMSEGTSTLPLLAPGQHTVQITAHDKAGNGTDANITLTITPIIAPTISPLSSDIFIGEGGISLSGTSKQGKTVTIRLLRQNGELVESATPTVDEAGNWSALFDHPLSKGKYFFEVLARDERGALSFPVRTAIFTVRARPFLVLAGLEISETVFFLCVIVLLGLGFGLGFAAQRRQKRKRGLRVLMSQRDIISSFDQMRKELEGVARRFRGKNASEAEAEEYRLIAKRVHGRLEKIEKYILDNIEEINK